MENNFFYFSTKIDSAILYDNWSSTLENFRNADYFSRNGMFWCGWWGDVILCTPNSQPSKI